MASLPAAGAIDLGCLTGSGVSKARAIELGRDLHLAQSVLEQLLVAPSTTDRGRLIGRLAPEFPSVYIDVGEVDAAHVRASDWDSDAFDTWAFDGRIDELAERPLVLVIHDDAGTRQSFPIEVLNRCQRVIGRRNGASQGPAFDRVLRVHRELHDRSKPLVRADYDHALDVWQWTLRLEPAASLALQIAALFHDVERLTSEPDARVEHQATDYQAFKDAHAREGARLTSDALACCGLTRAVVDQVTSLVAQHESPRADGDAAILADADGLSFISLNSCGYADYFGAEQLRRKVAYTLGRIRPSARRKLDHVRLRGDVRAALVELQSVTPQAALATR